MILVRSVFQAKYGKGGELVALFKEARQMWTEGPMFDRILTDASGNFFTVVTETEMNSLTEWDQMQAQIFSHPDFGAWFERMVPLVDSGRREFYNIEG